MANFGAVQSFNVTGLCATLTSTDVSDYTSNIEGYTEDEVGFRRFTWRNNAGLPIKTDTFTDGTKTSSVAINLLTYNLSCTLDVFFKEPLNLGYQAQQTFNIACLLV